MTLSSRLKGYITDDRFKVMQLISYYSVIIIVALIPTYVWFIPPFMVLWGISWVLSSHVIKENLNINRYAVIVFSFFMLFCLWQLIGITYSLDRQTGLRFFFSRLSLLLFPLVLVVPASKIRENINLILRLFVVSTTTYVLLCYIISFYRSISIINGGLMFNPHPSDAPWTSYFYGYYFSYNQHASYFSLYVMVSAFIALESFADRRLKLYQRIYWLIDSLFLISSVYLLSSRTAFLLYILLVPAYLFIRFRDKVKLVVSVFLFLFVLSIGIIATLTNWKTREIIDSTFNGKFKEIVVRDGRFVIWKAALNPIRKNILFGVGTGAVDSVMKEEYLKIGNKELIKGKYNLHNQFLEVLLENGIIGLLLFLAILSSMIYTAISQRNLLYAVFIIEILIFFLFETGLNRLPGVSFFSLFSFLLIYLPHYNNLKS
jgi:O-antigen ligase